MWKRLCGARGGVWLRHSEGLNKATPAQARTLIHKSLKVDPLVSLCLPCRNARTPVATPQPANLLRVPSVQPESAATPAKSVWNHTDPNCVPTWRDAVWECHLDAFPIMTICVLSALQLKATGSICRPKSGDCDLEEYCTGFSASCPTDAFTLNGLACNRGAGYCYNGQCPSHQQHCRRLWGPGKTPATSCQLQRDSDVLWLLFRQLSGLCLCLEAKMAVEACYLRHGTCRKTLFNQKCSQR